MAVARACGSCEVEMGRSSVFATVVTHDGLPWIEQCLDSLALSSCVPEIMVVDNNSSDDTRLFVRRFTGANCVPLDRNLGE